MKLLIKSATLVDNASDLNFKVKDILIEDGVITEISDKIKSKADKIITLGKKGNLSNKKILFSKLQDKNCAKKVFSTLSKRYEKRNGGYTRIIKAGFRYGDKAPMAVIEFVDRDFEAKKVDKKKKEISKVKKEEKKITKP